MTTWLICWMSVLARAMSWPVCAWSWNAKCRRWRCAKSRCAQVGLDAVREAERGVAPQRPCRRPARRRRARSAREYMTIAPLSPGMMPWSIAAAASSGIVILAAGPDDAGEHAGDDPAALAAERPADEPPPGSAQLALPIHRRSLPHWGRLQATGG